jgi:small-conductance mechanosensitive channel
MFDYINISPELISKTRQIALTILIGYIVIQVLVIVVRKLLFKNASKQSKMIINKGVIYVGVIVILLTIINILELKSVFNTMLGAAGVIGIVLGIASQTSIGNIVSGLFLVSEKPFEIGDLIRVGDKLGTVQSIDLLSIKLITLDNLLIRIPNQTIISTEVINITKFPIRRMDIVVGVAYKEDLKKVTAVLKSVAAENPLCLDEPEPLIIVDNFNTSSIDFKFGVWFEKSNFVKVRNSIFQQITEKFAAEGIEIPFPHISLYTGEATKPFPHKVVKE